LWPRIACRVSSATPAARSRRPIVCRRSCTCSVRNPSGRLHRTAPGTSSPPARGRSAPDEAHRREANTLKRLGTAAAAMNGV
jgi:hypothetical protein